MINCKCEEHAHLRDLKTSSPACWFYVINHPVSPGDEPIQPQIYTKGWSTLISEISVLKPVLKSLPLKKPLEVMQSCRELVYLCLMTCVIRM